MGVASSVGCCLVVALVGSLEAVYLFPRLDWPLSALMVAFRPVSTPQRRLVRVRRDLVGDALTERVCVPQALLRSINLGDMQIFVKVRTSVSIVLSDVCLVLLENQAG